MKFKSLIFTLSTDDNLSGLAKVYTMAGWLDIGNLSSNLSHPLKFHLFLLNDIILSQRICYFVNAFFNHVFKLLNVICFI